MGSQYSLSYQLGIPFGHLLCLFRIRFCWYQGFCGPVKAVLHLLQGIIHIIPGDRKPFEQEFGMQASACCRENVDLLGSIAYSLKFSYAEEKIGEWTYACERVLCEVRTSSPSLFILFFSCILL